MKCELRLPAVRGAPADVHGCAAAVVDNLEANLIASAEDLADSLSRDNVDVLARLASRTNHLQMEDIEMCRALPIDESHLLIETMTCTGEDQLCLMHATPVDIPDECVLVGGISADCVVDALESRDGGERS